MCIVCVYECVCVYVYINRRVYACILVFKTQLRSTHHWDPVGGPPLQSQVRSLITNSSRVPGLQGSLLEIHWPSLNQTLQAQLLSLRIQLFYQTNKRNKIHPNLQEKSILGHECRRPGEEARMPGVDVASKPSALPGHWIPPRRGHLPPGLWTSSQGSCGQK